MALDRESGILIKKAIDDAIDNLRKELKDSLSYDRTYKCKVIEVQGDGYYKVKIYDKEYSNLKSLNSTVYSVNDIVYCVAPQNQMSLLYIIGGYTPYS
jgi:hypothetical protein